VLIEISLDLIHLVSISGKNIRYLHDSCDLKNIWEELYEKSGTIVK
jgi:hypothetical protein